MDQETLREKKMNMIIAAVLIIIGIVMAVISWQILPESVATQPAKFSTGAPNMPKFAAVLFPLGMVILFAVSGVNHRKSARLCLCGYILNILLWLSN